MQLRVDDIKEQGLLLDYCEPVESFPALEEIQREGQVVFEAPITVSGRVQRIDQLIEVEGEVGSQVKLACSRCLEPVSLPVRSRFALTYSQGTPEIVDEETGEEVELTAEEMGLIPFDGEEIDLAEAIQEQVVMALPVQPLCRPECLGLCPQCGADRNRESCDCQPLAFNNRFGKLKDLKIESDKDR